MQLGLFYANQYWRVYIMPDQGKSEVNSQKRGPVKGRSEAVDMESIAERAYAGAQAYAKAIREGSAQTRRSLHGARYKG